VDGVVLIRESEVEFIWPFGEGVFRFTPLKVGHSTWSVFRQVLFSSDFTPFGVKVAKGASDVICNLLQRFCNWGFQSLSRDMIGPRTVHPSLAIDPRVALLRIPKIDIVKMAIVVTRAKKIRPLPVKARNRKTALNIIEVSDFI
jgi:hypothetical protein